MATESALSLNRGAGSFWVRANLSSAFPAEDEVEVTSPIPALHPAPKRAPGPRFVEPYRLDASQRAALLSALDAEDLGDDESRQIFLAALEYDLAACRPLLAERNAAREKGPLPNPPESSTAAASEPGPPSQTPRLAPSALPIAPPLVVSESAPHAVPLPGMPEAHVNAPSHRPVPESVLLALAELAHHLAQALAELTQEQREVLKQALGASDCLARGYGDPYLDALRLELLHFGMAFLPPDPERRQMSPALTPAPSPPPIPVEVQNLLQRAADAYGDCFEVEPTLIAGTAFPRIMRVLGDVTGLSLPLAETALQEILATGR